MGMRPADFWALSPVEWRWLVAGAEAPGRAGFEALAALYPDTEGAR